MNKEVEEILKKANHYDKNYYYIEAIDLFKQADKLKQSEIEKLTNELGILKGIETGKSTHRCAYCEDFYADEDNLLDEHEGRSICGGCHVEVLKDKNEELKGDLEASDRCHQTALKENEVLKEILRNVHEQEPLSEEVLKIINNTKEIEDSFSEETMAKSQVMGGRDVSEITKDLKNNL